jgi:tetratricopeptide (TPR) repeat protein
MCRASPGRDDRVGRAAPLPACRAADAAWEDLTERATTAWESGRHDEALDCYRSAAAIASAFAAADPRSAAARANLAAAQAEVAGRAAKPSALSDAALAWERARSWIDTMTVDHKPRSSLFHHRLERKHPGAYQESARHGYRRMLEGGRAACLNNLANCLAAAGRTAEAEALYREALPLRRAAFGARDIGVMRILENLAALLRGRDRGDEPQVLREEAKHIRQRDPLPPVRRWVSQRPQRFADVRYLLSAAYLSVLVPSGAAGPALRRRGRPLDASP